MPREYQSVVAASGISPVPTNGATTNVRSAPSARNCPTSGAAPATGMCARITRRPESSDRAAAVSLVTTAARGWSGASASMAGP